MFGLRPKDQRFKILREIDPVADDEPGREVRTLVVHHTAGNPMDTAEDIDEIHTLHKGWSLIGYHFAVLRNGLIQRGRPIHMTPASVKGKNSGTVAMVLCGNFEVQPAPHRLDPQAAAAGLLAAAVLESVWTDESIKMVTHRQLAATACPGKNLTDEMIWDYVLFVQRNFYLWARMYEDHVKAFDKLRPGYRYEE